MGTLIEAMDLGVKSARICVDSTTFHAFLVKVWDPD